MMLVMASEVEAGEEGQPGRKTATARVVSIGKGHSIVPVRQPGAKDEKLQCRQEGRQGPEDEQIWHAGAEDEDGDPNGDREHRQLTPAKISTEESHEPGREPVGSGGMEIGIFRRARRGVVSTVGLAQAMKTEAGVKPES